MSETKDKLRWCGEDIETLPKESLLGIIAFLHQQLEATRDDMAKAARVLEFSRRNRKGL